MNSLQGNVDSMRINGDGQSALSADRAPPLYGFFR